MTLSFDSTDHPARVLIVDDEPHNRQLLEVVLASGGYVLQTAKTPSSHPEFQDFRSE